MINMLFLETHVTSSSSSSLEVNITKDRQLNSCLYFNFASKIKIIKEEYSKGTQVINVKFETKLFCFYFKTCITTFTKI